MSDSLSFGGVDLSGTSYGVTVVEGAVEILSSPRISTVERPNAHGSIVAGRYMQTKHLVIPCVIEGSSFSDMLAKFHALRGLFHPLNGDKQVILDYQNDRYITGRLESGLESEPFGNRAVRIDLKFVCGDPTWYGTTLRTGQVTSSVGFDIAYAGSEYTPVTLIGKQGTTGASSRIQIFVANTTIDSTTVGRTEINPYRLSAGQYIRFDSVREIVEVSMDGSEWVPLMQYLVLSDTYGVRTGFQSLKPGVTNEISYAGVSDFSDGYWEYQYYDRYL